METALRRAMGGSTGVGLAGETVALVEKKKQNAATATKVMTDHFLSGAATVYEYTKALELHSSARQMQKSSTQKLRSIAHQLDSVEELFRNESREKMFTETVEFTKVIPESDQKMRGINRNLFEIWNKLSIVSRNSNTASLS